MNLKCVASIAVVAALIVFGAVTPVRAVPFVLNGSLADLDGNFVNDADNFDQLAAGATSISNWTVSAGTTANIAWSQTVTGDGRSASFGDFFIDLSGFGSEYPNGAIEQLLSGLLIGGTYNVALFSSGTIPLVTVGGAVVALSSGSSVVAGIDTYTQLTGTFDAGASNLLLKIANDTPGAPIVFIDNVAVDGASGTTEVTEPGTLALFGIGFAGLGLWRRRSAACLAS